MDPQQELFTEIRDILNRMYDGRVYDGFMPPEGTPYPFIYIADTRQDDVASKGAIFGYISVDLLCRSLYFFFLSLFIDNVYHICFNTIIGVLSG